jgi:hypothetical protein
LKINHLATLVAIYVSSQFYNTAFSGPGVYLPLLWEPSQCSTSPIALGYTRGHFCALIPPEPSVRQHLHSAPASGRLGAATASMFYDPVDVGDGDKSTFLPLTSSGDEGKQLLPIQVPILPKVTNIGYKYFQLITLTLLQILINIFW